MSSDSHDSADDDAQDYNHGDIVDVKDLTPPEGPQDPRIVRNSDHIDTLRDRHSHGFLSPLIFAAEEGLIVDGNYRREVLRELADLYEDSSYRQLEVTHVKDGYVYAVPTQRIEMDPETASMELNLYRENNSQADCAQFLEYLIESRVINADEYGVAGDTTAGSLLGHLEHAEDGRRDDTWAYSEEAKQLLYRFMQDLTFGTPGKARKYVTLLKNAPDPVVEAWAREDIGQSHVEELTEIGKLTNEETLERYLEATISGEHTRDDLRDIKADLKTSEETLPEDVDGDPPSEPQPPETPSSPDLSLTESQEEQLETVLEHRTLSREEYRAELADAEDIDTKLEEDLTAIEDWLQQGNETPKETRMQERAEALEAYDFETDSRFADGKTAHLAPPVETEQLGVFFHDCQQMDDELADESVHLVFSSPPYFTQRDRIVERWWPEDVEMTEANVTEANVDRAYQNFLDEMVEVLELLHTKLKSGGHLLFVVSDTKAYELDKVYDIPSDLSYCIRRQVNESLPRAEQFRYETTITWDKVSTTDRAGAFFGSGNPGSYYPNWRTERILVCRKGEKRPNKDYTVDPAVFQPYSDELWRIEQDKQTGDHDAAFPVALPKTAVQLYSYPGETVIDPFGGHATTLRAVKQLNNSRPDKPARKGFAWENFASETDDQIDYRAQIERKLGLRPLSHWMT